MPLPVPDADAHPRSAGSLADITGDVLQGNGGPQRIGATEVEILAWPAG